ncbi:MAG: pyridoxamine 5'-phosphate oxidase family protein [Lacibacter sp.]
MAEANNDYTLKMDDHIVAFLQEQSVINFATSINNQPYCASCYYAYVPGNELLVFKSDSDTKHIEDALKNNKVAGTIVPDKLIKAKIQGIQFTGVFKAADGAVGDVAKKAYLSKFPVAGLFRGNIWVVELSKVKFTDNTLVFGKKILWER